MGLIHDPAAPPKPEGKGIQMTTMIPQVEEPVIWCMVIACKSGNVYVGHQPGQELGTHKLCLAGAENLHKVLAMRLAEQVQSGIVGVAAPLAGLKLPPAPGRDS